MRLLNVLGALVTGAHGGAATGQGWGCHEQRSKHLATANIVHLRLNGFGVSDNGSFDSKRDTVCRLRVTMDVWPHLYMFSTMS